MGLARVLPIILLFVHSNTQTTHQKCVVNTFLLDAAVCGDSNYMQELAQLFQPEWKHIKIRAPAGTFSFAGKKLPMMSNCQFKEWINYRRIFTDVDSNRLNHVEDLDLSNVGVAIIPNYAFAYGIHALKRLNVANASIALIDETWFSNNNRLLELDLSHNRVKTLRRTQFRHLKHLRLLNLMNNDVENIEANSFQDLNQLTHLNLRHNNIRSIHTIGQLNRLQSLDLGVNIISEVNDLYCYVLHVSRHHLPS